MTKPAKDLRSLARTHTENAVQALAGIMLNGTNEGARVSAAGLLLERGWGKAPQVHAGDEDGGPIKVIIRQMFEKPKLSDLKEVEGKVIDQSPSQPDGR